MSWCKCVQINVKCASGQSQWTTYDFKRRQYIKMKQRTQEQAAYYHEQDLPFAEVNTRDCRSSFSMFCVCVLCQSCWVIADIQWYVQYFEGSHGYKKKKKSQHRKLTLTVRHNVFLSSCTMCICEVWFVWLIFINKFLQTMHTFSNNCSNKYVLPDLSVSRVGLGGQTLFCSPRKPVWPVEIPFNKLHLCK